MSEQFANAAQTTLNGAITAGATSLTVASASGFPSSAQFRILIDGELLIVTAGAGTTTWTVTRGAEGTTGAAHADGATVTHVLTAGSLGNLDASQIASGAISPARAGSGVNAQTGTSYTIADSDRGKLVTFNNAAAVAATLPQAGVSNEFSSSWFADFENRGAGAVTITPTTSTIDGAASLILSQNQGVRIFSDGTNYFTQRGIGNPGTVTSVALSVPSELSVSGSPVTSSGTLAVSKANQSANTVWAGPTSGGAAAPSFRALVTGDIPALDASQITGGVLPPARLGSGVNAQTGTSYTVADGDRGKLVTFSNAAAVAATLPQAGASNEFSSSWFADFENRGAGAVTITPTTSTIDGAASLVLNQNQGVRIFSDGTNYFTQRGIGGSSSSATVRPAVTDGRLTLASGTPLPDEDQTAKSTVYYTPYVGKQIALYYGGGWAMYDTDEISVSVPATLFRLFDIYAYYTGSAVALEAVNWDQSTGSITGATAAAPCVVTSNGHGLSNLDKVGVGGIVGTVGTDATNGVNGRIWTVVNVTANTFELQGSVTTGLAYTSGGTWYKIPNTRTTVLTTQDGVYVKSGDATRKYLGTGMTTSTSGQCEDSGGWSNQFGGRRYLWNLYNQVWRWNFVSDNTNSWTYTTAASRFRNNQAKNRIEIVCGLAVGDSCRAVLHSMVSNSSGTNVTPAIVVDRVDSNWSQIDGSRANTTISPYTCFAEVFSGVNALGAGYHYIAPVEHSTAAGTTTWYGDNGAGWGHGLMLVTKG